MALESVGDERVTHLTIFEALKLKDWASIGNDAYADGWPRRHANDGQQQRPRSRAVDDACNEVCRQVADIICWGVESKAEDEEAEK